MKIEPLPGTDTYRLCEDETITYKGKKYTMKAGVISDGASIPWFLQTLATTRYDPKIIRGAFWHDDFYEKQYISKKLSDEIFKFIILEDGLEKQVAENIYMSVKDFGGPAWKRCKKKLKNKKGKP